MNWSAFVPTREIREFEMRLRESVRQREQLKRELADREGLRVCKVTFGAEPSEREIMEFIDRNGHRLRYSQAVDTSTTLENRKNPKRQLREARRQTIPQGIGTKSQQALRQQQEQNKTVRLQRPKAEREAEQQRRFELRQAKKKEKHRGR